MNSSILTGRIATDIELKPVNETHVAKFRICVSERSKDAEPDYFSVVVWGKQAQAVEKFLSKGRKVAIRGKLKQERWTVGEGESAQKREKVVIVADEVEFLDYAKKDDAPQAVAASPVIETHGTPTVPPVQAVDSVGAIWNPASPAETFQLFQPPVVGS